MKLIYPAALLLSSLVAVFPVASRPTADSPATAILLATRDWEKHLQAQSFSNMRQYLQTWSTPGFSFNTATGLRAIDRLVETERNGVDSVRQAQAHFEKEYNVKLHSSVHLKLQSLHFHGDSALEEAQLSYRLPATGKKKMPNGMVQGEAGDLGHSEVYRITWTRTPLGWKMLSLKILPFSMIGTALFIEQAKGSGADHGK